ncbi:MAG: hypothetical protein ACYCSS_14960 [Sulfuriferula sp.]
MTQLTKREMQREIQAINQRIARLQAEICEAYQERVVWVDRWMAAPEDSPVVLEEVDAAHWGQEHELR